MVLVRCSMRRCRVRVSRSSLWWRSAHRAWSSRSEQPWQGWARSSARSRAISFSPSSSWRGRRSGRPPPALGGGVKPWVRARSVEARSRRDCGLRPLKVRGIRIRVNGSTGTGKSTIDSRRALRSAVST